MNLFSAAERLAALDHSTVTLVADRCLHTRDRFSECAACFELCPAGAITPGKPPVLENGKCQTCLACLPACPMGAYSADDAVPGVLNCAGRLENNLIELVCTKHPVAERGPQGDAVGVRVRGCLAGLGTGAYMILAALGLERILVRTDACGTCDWGVLRDEIELQISQAQKLLAPWGRSQIVECMPDFESSFERPLWQADNPPLSRRDLFRLAARQGQLTMARAIENGKMNAGLGPGRDRLRRIEAVTHLNEFAGNSTILTGMGYAWLSVTEACTACGVCGRACPTAVLSFDKNEDETSFTLTFSPRKCIGCELCVHVCAPEALSVNHQPTFEQVFGADQVPLYGGDLARCEQCKALYAKRPDVHVCPQCEYRRTHPFGTMLPPGVRPARPVSPEQHS